MRYRALLISGFISWGAPLLAATVGLFAYWLTRDQFLVNAGFLLLMIGFILGLVGIGCVLLFLLLNMRAAEPERQPERQAGRRKGLVAIALILFNLPMAVLYSLVGAYLAGQIYLEVINNSPHRLDQIAVISRAHRLDLEALNPGDKIDIRYNPKAETDVKIQIMVEKQMKEATITAYASMFGLDDSRIIISKDADIVIQKIKP